MDMVAERWSSWLELVSLKAGMINEKLWTLYSTLGPVSVKVLRG